MNILSKSIINYLYHHQWPVESAILTFDPYRSMATDKVTSNMMSAKIFGEKKQRINLLAADWKIVKLNVFTIL